MKIKLIFSKLSNSLQKKQKKLGVYRIIGYPKSGNTWLRVLLGTYVKELFKLQGPLPLFDTLSIFDTRIPPIDFTHGNLEWITQTANDLNLENTVFAYRQFSVVLLVRNIPDILVSLYWQAKTQVIPPYEGSISEFIRDPVHGVNKAIAFFQLWEKGHQKIHKLLLLRYEDLRINTATEFTRLLQFLQLPVDEHIVLSAIELCNFDNMRKLEIDNKETRKLIYESSGYPIFATGDVEKNKEAYRVRKGKINGFRDYLSEEDILFLQNSMNKNIPDWYKYQNGFWQ